MARWEVALGLETVQYIQDLVVTNPVSNDPIAQGDDHIRLLKTVLKNTFPQATRPIFFAAVQSHSSDFTLQQSDMSNTILVSTTGGPVNITLPALLIADAGWECFVIKTTNDINPMFIVPPSGTIQSGAISGLAKTRRCIPGIRTRIFWTGSLWFAERSSGAPVGAIVDYDGAALPVGFEWPNGQTLSSAANYPDYFSVKGSGVTRDLRGTNTVGKDDMGGTAKGLITVAGSGIDGTVLGAQGGSQFVVLQPAHLPVTSGNTGNDTPDHQHWFDIVYGGITASAPYQAEPNWGIVNQGANVNITTGASARHVHPVPTGGTAANLANVQPTTVLNKILVVE